MLVAIIDLSDCTERAFTHIHLAEQLLSDFSLQEDHNCLRRSPNLGPHYPRQRHISRPTKLPILPRHLQRRAHWLTGRLWKMMTMDTKARNDSAAVGRNVRRTAKSILFRTGMTSMIRRDRTIMRNTGTVRKKLWRSATGRTACMRIE